MPKPQKYSNFTDLDLSNNRAKKQSSNHTYCSGNNASEKKKAEDFKIFYGKIYDKYQHKYKEEIEKKSTTPNETKIESNNENDDLQSPEKNENIQKKIILSRMKKYKAIVNNENTQLSNYLKEISTNKSKIEVKGKNEHSPKNPIRARKFKLLS